MIHGTLKCPRRCFDCPDGNHHWIPDCVPPRSEVSIEDEDGDYFTDPHHLKAWELGIEVYGACKHCDAICDYEDLGDY